MPIFVCSVCQAEFEVPQQALEKYSNWSPKYCKQHSPKRSGGSKDRGAVTGAGKELDLPLEEVLKRFHQGPDSGVFTDGSARPNPGPGGWGVVFVERGEIIEQKMGQSAQTTNNQMELTALIEGYKLLSATSSVDVYTDSELCFNIINKWAAGWQKRGWKRKDGPVKNLELVQELYRLTLARPQARLKWVKAHNGWRWNEYADSLATAWAREKL